MKPVVKQPKRTTLGDFSRNISVTFNSENPIEAKIADMKFYGWTEEEYEKVQQDHQKRNEKYKEFADIDCTYRGTTIKSVVPYEERYKYVNGIVKDLSFLDTCFKCDGKMIDHSATDVAFDLFDYNSGGPYIGEDWEDKNAEVLAETEKQIADLKSRDAFVTLQGRAHEIISTMLKSHCPACGNIAEISVDLTPVTIVDYGIKEYRATVDWAGKGALLKDTKTGKVIPMTDLFTKPAEGIEIITHGHPNYSATQKEMAKQLMDTFNDVIAQALKLSAEEVAKLTGSIDVGEENNG